MKPLQDDPNSEREKKTAPKEIAELNPCKSNNSEAIKIGVKPRLAQANPFNPCSNEKNRNLLLRIKKNKIKKKRAKLSSGFTKKQVQALWVF